MSSERLDVVIFGASGYTGKFTIYEAVKVLSGLKWGVAGRSKEKVESALSEMCKKAGTDLSKIPIIIADVKNEKSLLEMASQAKIIINCCGPFRHFGEPVVKACVESGTHHIDVSGEPEYMETMQLKYNEKARENGAYIITACGFDSIPADLGTVFLQQKFNGTLNSVETYLRTYFINNYKSSGAGINFGTFESAVYGLANADKLRGIRTKLYPTRLPRFQPALKDRSTCHKSDIVNRWCLPFPGSDRSVVMRSQRHFYEKENARPVQMRAYVSFDSLFYVICVMFIGAVFALMSKFSFGRKLLLSHPKFFTAGMVSHEGPAEETNENLMFEMIFSGEGWKEKQSDPTSKFDMPMNKKVVTRITGPNPGYGSTCICLLVSAITILKESDKLPEKGGVFPPAAAFKNTSMISELQKNNLTFEVIKVEE